MCVPYIAAFIVVVVQPNTLIFAVIANPDVGQCHLSVEAACARKWCHQPEGWIPNMAFDQNMICTGYEDICNCGSGELCVGNWIFLWDEEPEGNQYPQTKHCKPDGYEKKI